MNIVPGLRALASLAFVAATTVVIVAPELLAGAQAAAAGTLNAAVAISHP